MRKSGPQPDPRSVPEARTTRRIPPKAASALATWNAAVLPPRFPNLNDASTSPPKTQGEFASTGIDSLQRLDEFCPAARSRCPIRWPSSERLAILAASSYFGSRQRMRSGVASR